MDKEKMIRGYWEQIDQALIIKGITLTTMCNDLSLKRKSIYSQRTRRQMPKLDEYLKIAEYLDLPIEELHAMPTPKSPYEEYLPYLEKADQATLSSIRKLLDMPQEEKTVRLPSRVMAG